MRSLRRVASMLLLAALAVAPALGDQPATPLPATAPAVIILNGRLLDLANGYVYFSSGDAYKLATGAVLSDLTKHRALSSDDVTARYGLAIFSANGEVTQLEVSDTAIPIKGSQNNDAHQFAVAATTMRVNPELADHHDGFTGEPVLVVFTVEVPPTTGFNDSVYMSTEASGWDAMAIKMDRVDALHFRITRTLSSGTHYVYRFTRGTWRSAERQENGLEGGPRTYIVQNLDVARRKDTVYHWSDENPSGGNLPGPNSVPTPQSGRPFQFTQ